MRLPQEVNEDEDPYLQYDRKERHKQLAALREQIRLIGQEIFDVSCQLQRQFDAKDVNRALVLVAELKTLKSFEAELTRRNSYGSEGQQKQTGRGPFAGNKLG